MSKKILTSFLIFGTLFLNACNSASQTNDQVTLEIIYGAWPPDLISYLAESKGYYDQYDVNVKLIKTVGYEDMRVARQQGSNPKIWGYTTFDFLKEYFDPAIEKPQIIMVQGRSAGADAIVSNNPEINTPSDLANKKIALEPDTINELFLYLVLESADLKLDQLEIVSMPTEDTPASLIDQTIDAAVIFEPFLTEAKQNGARVIIDSNRERNSIIDGYITFAKDVEKYPETYQRFMQANLKAVEFFEENPEEALAIMTDPFDLSIQELKEAFKGIELIDLEDNRILIEDTSGPDSIYSNFRNISRYLEEELNIPIDQEVFTEMVNPDLLPQEL